MSITNNLKSTTVDFTIDSLFIGGDPSTTQITLTALGAGAEAAIGATLPRGTIVYNIPYSNGSVSTSWFPLGAGWNNFNSILVDESSGALHPPTFGILVHDTPTDDDGTVTSYIYTSGRFNKQELLAINDGDSFLFFDGNAMTATEKEVIVNLLLAQGFDIVNVI